MTTILTDHDLDNEHAMQVAMEAIEQVLKVKVEGRLVAPPRHIVPFAPSGDLLLTIGGAGGDNGLAGFRAYTTFEAKKHDQLVAVWQTETGVLTGLVLGRVLGELRTGAIGGTAIKYMAREDAGVIGIVGAGRQAFAQVAAARLVRPIREVRVFNRTAEARNRFAEEINAQFGLAAIAVDSAKQAVEGADIVICGTTSGEAVIAPDWLAPGTHVTSLGPKMIGESEIPQALAGRAAVIATDSRAQACNYAKPFFLENTQDMARMVELDRLITDEVPGRTGEDDITLFCSVGLAGTEVYVAARLIAALGGG